VYSVLFSTYNKNNQQKINQNNLFISLPSFPIFRQYLNIFHRLVSFSRGFFVIFQGKPLKVGKLKEEK